MKRFPRATLAQEFPYSKVRMNTTMKAHEYFTSVRTRFKAVSSDFQGKTIQSHFN